MTREDLQETAALAHLNLKDEELKAALPAFEQMLGFFAAMQAADNDTEAFSVSIAGLSHQTHTVGADFFRQDTVREPDAEGIAKEQDGTLRTLPADGDSLINNAGERDGGFIVIPNVL
ncbi:MAG: aspartyl/glutamyl-tRNA amidotransferase subunit C [Treponema sp.]|jgi:aspartyl-tRNA(Asn)/glutamyl-tRNA(Gln) amidotransferase subunit C|nr:aspartyl/glutamyl-tRNA amidotransferase subunit C [Treponema sp.]